MEYKIVTAKGIIAAHERIFPYIMKTPLEKSIPLSEELQSNVYMKLENFQKSGSFKPRGGFNKIIKFSEHQPGNTFVAPTAGGHGVGLSYAGQILGAKVHIMMPKSADPDRVKVIEQYGATISYYASVPEARAAAHAAANEQNTIFVSAYNDLEMIEGGGTIALEMLSQIASIDCLVCGVGGGGYISGMAAMLKSVNPQIEIVGVQQENAPLIYNWFKTGVYEITSTKPSIAEGVGATIEEDSITFPLMREYVDDFVLVSENEIADAVKWMMEHHKHYVEPSGVVGLAALKKYPSKFRQYSNIATVITGRNISYNLLMTILTGQTSHH